MIVNQVLVRIERVSIAVETTYPYIGAHPEYLPRIYNLGLKLEVHFPILLGVALFRVISCFRQLITL